MTLIELIETAKDAAGSYGQLAERLGCHQNRITDWKKGKARPDASKIACMAEISGLPVLTTLADVEAQVDPEHSATWRAALGKLKAAGVAAAVAVTMVTPQDDAMASTPTSQLSGGAMYIMSTIARMLRRLSWNVIKCLRPRPKASACI